MAQQDQTNLALDDIYWIANTVQRESGSKTSKAFNAVKEEVESYQENEDDIAAFQSKKPSRGAKTIRNYQAGQNRSRN
jgi:hypothetical protein